jgi:hypothetical protein
MGGCTPSIHLKGEMERKTSLQITHALQSSCITRLNPWFITGFADAEASFSILIQHNTKFNTNWRVKAIFSIGLHKKDLVLLESLRQTLGVGKIHKHFLFFFSVLYSTFKSILVKDLILWQLMAIRGEIWSPNPRRVNEVWVLTPPKRRGHTSVRPQKSFEQCILHCLGI